MKKSQSQKVSKPQIKSWYAIDLPELKPTTYSYNFVIFAVAFLFSMVFLSAFIDAPSAVDVTGKLVLENPAIPVKALKPMIVFKNSLVENQYVSAGAVLITSTYGMSLQSLTTINQLSAELENLNNSQEECSKCLYNIVMLTESINFSTDKNIFPEVHELVKIDKSSFKNLAQEMRKLSNEMRTIFAKIEDSDRRSNQKRSTASQNDKIKAQAQVNRTQLMTSYNQLNLKYGKFRESFSTIKNYLRPVQTSLKARMIQMEQNENIVAPFSGKITNVKIKGTGEFINPGQVLFELVPEKSDLVVLLDIPNKDVSLFRVGDTIDVAVDAFPEYDYGRIVAKVTKILEPESSENFGQQPAKGFRAQATLSSQIIQGKNKESQLLNGMTLRARTQKMKESLLKSFARTIFKFKDDLRN